MFANIATGVSGLVYKAYLTTTAGKELVVVKNGKSMYSDSMCIYTS